MARFGSGLHRQWWRRHVQAVLNTSSPTWGFVLFVLLLVGCGPSGQPEHDSTGFRGSVILASSLLVGDTRVDGSHGLLVENGSDLVLSVEGALGTPAGCPDGEVSCPSLDSAVVMILVDAWTEQGSPLIERDASPLVLDSQSMNEQQYPLNAEALESAACIVVLIAEAGAAVIDGQLPDHVQARVIPIRHRADRATGGSQSCGPGFLQTSPWGCTGPHWSATGAPDHTTRRAVSAQMFLVPDSCPMAKASWLVTPARTLEPVATDMASHDTTVSVRLAEPGIWRCVTWHPGDDVSSASACPPLHVAD